MSVAEQSHEIGRTGVLRAKDLLWRLMGKAINLPFNAYDHRPKLTFQEIGAEKEFAFDLAGILTRKDHSRAGGQNTVEVFVEVKAVKSGDSLLQEFREFLRHAATVSIQEKHQDTWFIFLSEVPFGSSYGVELCDGALVKECQQNWDASIQPVAATLSDRISLIVATKSFQRLLTQWRPS